MTIPDGTRTGIYAHYFWSGRMAQPMDVNTHDCCQRTAACISHLQTALRCPTKSVLSAGRLHVHVFAVCGAVCTRVAFAGAALSDGCVGDVWEPACGTCACASRGLPPWKHCLRSQRVQAAALTHGVHTICASSFPDSEHLQICLTSTWWTCPLRCTAVPIQMQLPSFPLGTESPSLTPCWPGTGSKRL